jgi:simple sugar transport system permease protein
MESVYFFIESLIRISLPILWASMGGFVSEKSGVINLALEGFMLLGAFVAASVVILSGSYYWGWAACFGVGLAAGLVYAWTCLEWRVNQVVAGTAFNLFALGLCPLLGNILFDSTGATPPISPELRNSFFVYSLLILSFFAILLFYKKSIWGMNLRFAGESPGMFKSVGKNLNLTRYFNVAFGCSLAAMGGAVISTYLSSGFARNMIAGRGFIAVAAVVLGRWRPIPVFGACILFAAGEAMQIRMQGSQWLEQHAVPTQLVQILPYFLTLLILVCVNQKSGVPKGLGRVD